MCYKNDFLGGFAMHTGHLPGRLLPIRVSRRTLPTLALLLLAFPLIAGAQTWGNPVWSDEFNGAANSAIDPANWQYDTGILNVNNEVEYYCAPGSSTPPCSAGTPSSSCYCGGNGLGQSYTFPSNDPSGPDVTTFHTYGAIWSTNMVQFYVDDPGNIFLVRTINDVPSGLTWDFNHPFFLLLNLAVGGTGSWPGAPDSGTPNPALMTVDYVRRYTPSPVAGPTMSGSPISVKAGNPGSATVSMSSTSGTGRVYLSCTTTAPKATCSINSGDPLNQYTVDFSKR